MPPEPRWRCYLRPDHRYLAPMAMTTIPVRRRIRGVGQPGLGAGDAGGPVGGRPSRGGGRTGDERDHVGD